MSTDDVEVTRQARRLAEEAQLAVLLQGAGEQAGLGQDLEAIADADHWAAGASEGLHCRHDRREAGQRTGTQVVTVREAAREHDGVNRPE